MLLITRRAGQEIHVTVGETVVRIVFIKYERGYVRLGFDGPPEAAISRPDAINHEPPLDRRPKA